MKDIISSVTINSLFVTVETTSDIIVPTLLEVELDSGPFFKDSYENHTISNKYINPKVI